MKNCYIRKTLIRVINKRELIKNKREYLDKAINLAIISENKEREEK